MGFAAVIIKSAHAPGVVTAFYRMAIGSVILLLPFLLWTYKKKSSLPIKGIAMAVIGGASFGIDLILWSTGVEVSNATIPTLFANTAPIWVGFGSILFFKEKHRKLFWFGLFIAFSGILILVHKDLNANNGILKGALLGLGGGIFYGTFYLTTQKGRKQLDTLSFLFFSTTSAAVVLGLTVIITGNTFVGYDHFTWWHFLAIGVVVQVIGWFFVNYAQGFLTASVVAPTMLAQPLLTAFLAIIILKENLTLWHMIGGLIILTGIYLVHYSRNK